MFCTRCGKKNPDEARFCYACGTALPAAPRVEAAAAEAPRVAAPFAPYRVETGAIPAGQPAGFWRRAAALCLDVVIVLLAASVLTGFFAGITFAGGGDAAAGAVFAVYLVTFVGGWLYYAFSESSSAQATLGKRAIGIFVTDIDGGRIGFGRATGRYFAKLINSATIGIGWMMAGFTDEKRALQDYIAGTRVLRREGHKSSGVVIAVVALALAVPFIGIVAAIAVPGLLRARQAGNEASAIGVIRNIQSAQQAYFAECSAYAPSLVELRRRQRQTLADVPEGTDAFEHLGYTVTISAAQGAGVAVTDGPCRGAVTDYTAVASPVSFGSTGSRYFATNATGTIYQDTTASFTGARVIQ